MQEIISALPAISGLVEKGGIVGLLIVMVGVLIYERMRLTKELTATYKERDTWRLRSVIYKQACDGANLHPDMSQLNDFIQQGA